MRCFAACYSIPINLFVVAVIVCGVPSSNVLATIRSPDELRPNVLLVMTDDQGFGDIGSHGNDVIETPVLDHFAESGARFDRFYVSPVCAPTRAGLLTGRYPLRSGVQGVTRGWETIRASELTVAELLKSAGYATGCFGKWHSGRHMPNHPNGQGFDEFFGFTGGHWNNYFEPGLQHNGNVVATEGYVTDVLTDKAIEFIDANHERPWFCYVPYNAPHSPWQIPDRYWDKYSNKGLDPQAQCAYAMIDCIDANFKRLLDTIDRHHLTQRTIVLFLTDNGLNSQRYNAGMRGRKGSVHEGGVRVPLFIRWPGKIAPGTSIKQIASHIDILPTLVDLCGVVKPVGPPLDGISLRPLLENSLDKWPDRVLFTDRHRAQLPSDQSNGAVRTEQWRATYEKGRWSLFDMISDPGQVTDVAAQHPEELRQLTDAYDQWYVDVTSLGLDYQPIPVGHASRATFELPANESFLSPGHGKGISYTGKGGAGFANCWLTDWTNGQAYPRWQLDVLQPGAYELSLQYTCRAEDVPVTMAISVGDEESKYQITEPFDPDLNPEPDRVSEGSYSTKPWMHAVVGTVHLAAGRQTLTVKGLEKHGAKFIDLKAVWLTRTELP